MHNFKKILPPVLCIIAFFAILWFLDTALYPITYTRNDLHTVSAEQKDVIILGTSNGKMNLDPDTMLAGTGLTGHNLCAGGQYPVDAYYLAKLVIEKQSPKMMILELDPGYYMMEKEPGNNYLLFYHEFPLSFAKAEYFMDTVLTQDFRMWLFPFYEYSFSFEVQHMGDTLKQKLGGIYDAEKLKNSQQAYHENGFIEKFPVDVADFPSYSPELFEEERILPESMDYLDKVIRLCRENDIDVIALSTPLPGGALKRDEEYFGAAWDYFGSFFDERDVPFYNFNKEYYTAFTHEDRAFVDFDGHMNGDAARAFSSAFGQIVWGTDSVPERS